MHICVHGPYRVKTPANSSLIGLLSTWCSDQGVTIGETIKYLSTNSDPKHYHKMLIKHKRNHAKQTTEETQILNES